MAEMTPERKASEIVAGWLALFMPYETKPTVTLRRVLEARIADALRAERERAERLTREVERLRTAINKHHHRVSHKPVRCAPLCPMCLLLDDAALIPPAPVPDKL